MPGREIAKRMTLRRFGQNLGQRRLPECLLYQRQGIVEALMQRAQPDSVGSQSERAFSYTANRFYRIDDIQNGQFRGIFCEGHSSPKATLRLHDIGLTQSL